MVVAPAVALFGALGAWAIAAAVASGTGVSAVDRPVLEFFAAHRPEWMTPWVAAFTRVGSAAILSILLLVLVVILCARRRTLYPFLVLAVSAGASVGLTVLLKNAFDRPRPPYALAVPPFEVSGSFPSGHTLNSTALAVVLAYLVLRWSVRRWVRIVVPLAALLYALAMGASRLYLGAHWCTDVLGGWYLGVALAGLVIAADVVLLRRAARA